MTHEEVRRLVPRYAAGDLPTADADTVRAHLVSGCADCLAEVFRHPVGLPVPARRAAPQPAPVVTSTHAVRAGALVVSGLVVLGAPLAVLSVLTYARVRALDGPARLEAGRLRETEAARMALAARVEQLERERLRAEAEAASQADAARAASEANAALQRRLESAEVPRAARPEGQVGRLLDSVDGQRTLEQLTTMPGVELLRLAAVGPSLEARGHVLWHPARPDMVVCAFRLPSLPDGMFYRVHLLGTDGAVDEAAAFRPVSAGDIVLPVRARDAINSLRAIELVRDPDGLPVLRGEVAQARSTG